MTPEARLAVALLRQAGLDQVLPPSAATQRAAALLAADPTIAADLTLAARLRDPADPLLEEAFRGWVDDCQEGTDDHVRHVEWVRAALIEDERSWCVVHNQWEDGDFANPVHTRAALTEGSGE